MRLGGECRAAGERVQDRRAKKNFSWIGLSEWTEQDTTGQNGTVWTKQAVESRKFSA
jgi:hypothetical protein